MASDLTHSHAITYTLVYSFAAAVELGSELEQSRPANCQRYVCRC